MSNDGTTKRDPRQRAVRRTKREGRGACQRVAAPEPSATTSSALTAPRASAASAGAIHSAASAGSASSPVTAGSAATAADTVGGREPIIAASVARQIVRGTADVARVAAHEIADAPRRRGEAPSGVGGDVAQAPAAGEPQSRHRPDAAFLARGVDRVRVQQHLDLALPALPRPAVGAARQAVEQRPSDGRRQRRRDDGGSGGGAREPRVGTRRGEREPVAGKMRVQRGDQRLRLVVGEVVDPRFEHDVVAARDQRDRIGGEHEIVACVEPGAERAKRRDRRIGGEPERVQRCRVEAVVEFARRLREQREARERGRRGERDRRTRVEAGNDQREVHGSRRGARL